MPASPNPVEKVWRKLKQELLHLHRPHEQWSVLQERVEEWLGQSRTPSPHLQKSRRPSVAHVGHSNRIQLNLLKFIMPQNRTNCYHIPSRIVVVSQQVPNPM
jgi:hypothetical protein